MYVAFVSNIPFSGGPPGSHMGFHVLESSLVLSGIYRSLVVREFLPKLVLLLLMWAGYTLVGKTSHSGFFPRTSRQSGAGGAGGRGKKVVGGNTQRSQRSHPSDVGSRAAHIQGHWKWQQEKGDSSPSSAVWPTPAAPQKCKNIRE